MIISKFPAVILISFVLFIHDINGQVQSTFHLGNEFQRFNIQEYDLKLQQPNIEDRMMCKHWCGNQLITMMDTLEVEFNFDLSESLFYIHMNEKIFTVKSHFIKSFIIDGRTHINYRKPYSEKAMILEVLVDGKYTLYKHHNLIYKEPDFNPVLSVGSKEGSYKMKYDYYVFCDERLIPISAKGKKALKKMQRECQIPSGVKVKGDIIDLFHQINTTH